MDNLKEYIDLIQMAEIFLLKEEALMCNSFYYKWYHLILLFCSCKIK